MINIISIFLTILLALIFGLTGIAKVLGVQKFKDNFTHLHLPQWFRFVTGILEVLAVILLIIGFWHTPFLLIGSLLLVCIGIGGALAHARMKHSLKDILVISVLALIAASVFIINY
jgi:putative oxidoreductase